MRKKVFKPIVFTWIPAYSHSERAEYYIAIGTEHWSEEKDDPYVIKIQMAYNRKRCGRKNPSYPIESNDWEAICNTVERIKKAFDEGKKGEIRI